ncbi:MAG: M6 family metalloprotease domain-containing protein [Paludibacteraceae bacterium]|nr:M6 family metalloprotease domain-containing protein [Paludibacteraceae bacterium]
MRRIGFIFVLISLCAAAFAVPADVHWQLFYQPDGTALELCLVGDEYERHYEGRDGYVYERREDGFWDRISKLDSEQRIASRRSASPFARRPRRAGEVNLAPRGLVILVNYSDISFDASNDLAGMTDMLNGENYTYEDATGSARRYFIDQSDGQYAPQFDVVGPVTLDHPRSYYGANSGSSLDVNASQMAVDACIKADEAGADFTLYDNNKDGTVDFVFIMFADKGEADGGPAESIWPHNWYVRTGAKKTCVVDGLYIDNYACAAEKNGRTGNRAGIGTFCHEFGHVIGLPDYYDTKSGINYSNHLTPRYWSIMDIGTYLNYGKTPPNYSAHDRYFMGWNTPVNLGTEEQRVTLNPLGQEGYVTYQVTASGQLVSARKEETVYYIECREKIGWDRYLPGHGMLIWQVKYSSSSWRNNSPNNTAYAPRYTILSATGSTTDIGTSSDSYPGKMEVTYRQLTANRTVSDITEENQQVSFVYNRTRKTVILTSESMLSLDDQTSASSPSFTVTGSFKDANGESYKARIQVLSSVYAGNYTSTNISLANSWLEQGGVRKSPTGVSGKVTISGQNLYHIDLSLTIDEFTTYRVVGDFKVSIAEPVQHTLDVNCSEGGAVTLLATDYTSKTNTGSYAEGTSVQLLPAPDKGWLFSAWGGKDANLVQSSGGIYRVTMGANDLALDAAFVRQSCEVRSACSPADKGSVTVRLGGNTLTSGSDVPYMTQVTFEAAAKDSYRFDGWNDGDITNPRTITVTGDTLLTALFSYVIPEPENHTVTVASSSYGQVRLRSINTKDNINIGTYLEGTTVILNPEPATGYQFAGWTGPDASQVTTGNDVYTIVIGRQDYSLDVQWTKREYAVTVESSPGGSGSTTVTADGKVIEDGQTVPYLTSVVVSATAAKGWTFSHWSDNENANPRNIQIKDALSLTAYFVRQNYTLTAAVSPEEKAYIDVTANGTAVSDLHAIPFETSLMLAVRPVQGWQFEQWNDGNADNPRTCTVTGDVSLTAEVARRLFTVSGKASPVNDGVVTMRVDSKVIPDGTALPYETEVVFEAVPAKSYRFDGWSDGETVNPRTVTLTDNLSLTALFSYVVPEPEIHTITVGASAYGQITLRSADKDDNVNSGTYKEGTTVMLVPQPAEGYELEGWQGKDAAAVKEDKGFYTIVIGKQDYELEAVWKKKSYPVTVSFSPDGKGSVALVADGNAITNGDKVEYGATVTLQVTPATGWKFTRWSDDETANPRNIQVKDAIDLTAQFERQTYSLTVSVSPAGKADVAMTAQGGGNMDPAAIPFETEMALTVTPVEGWQFDKWSDADRKNPRIISMTADMALTAGMIRRNYIVTSAVSPAGKGSVRLTVDGAQVDDGQLPYGTEAVFEAVPVAGWRFAGWSDGETANPRTVTVTATVGITAVMVREQYSVQTATLPAGKGEVDVTVNQTAVQSGQKADFESSVRMNAVPVEGWRFDGWSDGETVNPRTFILTQDTVMTARFSRKQYMLQTSASPSDKGTVIATANGKPLDSETQLEYETVVQLYASASANCHFVCWSDSVTDNPRMITLTRNMAYQAIFARDDIDYLSIREDGDSLYYDNMSAYEDAKVRLVVIERTIKANTYSTFCLPFDVTDLTSTDLCGSVLQFVSATGDAEVGMTLHFTFATEIKAGVPYLLLATDSIVNPFFKNVTMRGFESKTLRGGTVEFRSVVRPVHLMNMGKSVAAFRNNVVYYPNQTTGMYLNAFRAYFYIPGRATAPIRRINILSSDELPQEDSDAGQTTD